MNIEYVVKLVHRIPNADTYGQLNNFSFTKVRFQSVHELIIDPMSVIANKVFGQI